MRYPSYTHSAWRSQAIAVFVLRTPLQSERNPARTGMPGPLRTISSLRALGLSTFPNNSAMTRNKGPSHAPKTLRSTILAPVLTRMQQSLSVFLEPQCVPGLPRGCHRPHVPRWCWHLWSMEEVGPVLYVYGAQEAVHRGPPCCRAAKQKVDAHTADPAMS